jgi:hypothetical protein
MKYFRVPLGMRVHQVECHWSNTYAGRGVIRLLLHYRLICILSLCVCTCINLINFVYGTYEMKYADEPVC